MALPGAVLFACTQNKVRSPLAAALLRLRHGREVFVDSCGLKPAEEVDAFAAVVADEMGADLSRHAPKGFHDIDDGSFDLIVSLSPEAHHHALEFARHMACEVQYWPTIDPTAVEGTREQRLEAYRRTRDGLLLRIDERFGRASTFGG